MDKLDNLHKCHVLHDQKQASTVWVVHEAKMDAYQLISGFRSHLIDKQQ